MFPFYLVVASAMNAMRRVDNGPELAMDFAVDPVPLGPAPDVDGRSVAGRHDRSHRGAPGIARRSQANRRRQARRQNRAVTPAH